MTSQHKEFAGWAVDIITQAQLLTEGKWHCIMWGNHLRIRSLVECPQLLIECKTYFETPSVGDSMAVCGCKHPT